MPDSQLILLSYLKWGEECPKFLIGDFAFMIWDQKSQKLFGARDFSGSRTLYFHRNESSFAFCTTIAPLHTLPYADRKLNEEWLAEFLIITDMVETVNIFSTVYKDINQLPPAHTISIVKGRITFSRYCTLSINEILKFKKNEEYVEAFQEVFQSAVDARLRTNQNVGSQLSGGLDSGAVVSFAAKSLHKENKSLHTFSYVPEDDFIDWTPKYNIADERPFIKSTVQHVENITDHYLDLKGKSPLSEVDNWLEIMEMPYKFFGNSFWVKGIYEEAQKLGIGILLNGGRGNFTISWGPALEYYALLLKKMKWVALYRELHLYSKKTDIGRSRMFPALVKKAFPSINRFNQTKESYSLPKYINLEFAKRTNIEDKIRDLSFNIDSGSSTNSCTFRKNQFNQLHSWMLNGTAGTKLSLNYSLLERDPTNDMRVIKFCLSVPFNQFVQNGLDRALIRRATVNYLPDKVRLNQSVRGIQGADVIHRMSSSWNLLLDELENISKDSELSEFIDMDVINAALSRIPKEPQSNYNSNPEFKMLMRSLIIYRFLKKFT